MWRSPLLASTPASMPSFAREHKRLTKGQYCFSLLYVFTFWFTWGTFAASRKRGCILPQLHTNYFRLSQITGTRGAQKSLHLRKGRLAFTDQRRKRAPATSPLRRRFSPAWSAFPALPEAWADAGPPEYGPSWPARLSPASGSTPGNWPASGAGIGVADGEPCPSHCSARRR